MPIVPPRGLRRRCLIHGTYLQGAGLDGRADGPEACGSYGRNVSGNDQGSVRCTESTQAISIPISDLKEQHHGDVGCLWLANPPETPAYMPVTTYLDIKLCAIVVKDRRRVGKPQMPVCRPDAASETTPGLFALGPAPTPVPLAFAVMFTPQLSPSSMAP
jgi:hypothetical protein